jgi:hypothetical protein
MLSIVLEELPLRKREFCAALQGLHHHSKGERRGIMLIVYSHSELL